MQEQSLALRLPSAAPTLPQPKPDEALVKMWDETERTILDRVPPNLPAKHPDQAEQAQRVRYSYD